MDILKLLVNFDCIVPFLGKEKIYMYMKEMEERIHTPICQQEIALECCWHYGDFYFFFIFYDKHVFVFY